LQSSDAYKGALDCATKIVKQEGPLAFYKGVSLRRGKELGHVRA
jgi:solute carrier family 25 carnitine/acylcarnitine transporter 20/29